MHVPAWGVVFPPIEAESLTPDPIGFVIGGSVGEAPPGPDALLKLPAHESKKFKLRGRYNDIRRFTIEGPQGHVMWYRMPAARQFHVRALLNTMDEQHRKFLHEEDRRRGITQLWKGKVTSGPVMVQTTDQLVPKHERFVPAQRGSGPAVDGLALTLWCSSAEWRPGDEILLGCVYHNTTDQPIHVPAWGVLSPAMDLQGPVDASRATDGQRELIYPDVFAEVPAHETKTFYRRAVLDASGRLSMTWPTGAIQTWHLQNGQYRFQALLDTSGHEPVLKRHADWTGTLKDFWQGKAHSGPVEVKVSGISRPAGSPAGEAATTGQAANGLVLALTANSTHWKPGDQIELTCTYRNSSGIKPLYVPVWGMTLPAVDVTRHVDSRTTADAVPASEIMKQMQLPQSPEIEKGQLARNAFVEVLSGQTATVTRRAVLGKDGQLTIHWPKGIGQTWSLQDGRFRLQALLKSHDDEARLAELAREAKIQNVWYGKALSGTVDVTVTGIPSQAETDLKEIVIDRTKFGSDPDAKRAVFFNPLTGETCPAREDRKLGYDIWIEPNDPEFKLKYANGQRVVDQFAQIEGRGFFHLGKGEAALQDVVAPDDDALVLSTRAALGEGQADWEQQVLFCKTDTCTALIMFTAVDAGNEIVRFKWKVLTKW
jgi:hypothetical protein